MNVMQLNALLAAAKLDVPEAWPRLRAYEAQSVKFAFDFGLSSLPTDPGIVIVRGPRQYGKSTWLDLQLRASAQQFGKGSSFYLNGDDIASVRELENQIMLVIGLFAKSAPVRRLFIDEITAIDGWEKCIKRMWDRGDIRDVLVITTGSKAFDLRRGSERLPGRKGRLERTDFVFLPISYQEFFQQCHARFRDKTWLAYLLTGGSPIHANDLYTTGFLAESSVQTMRDWVLGEVVKSGRNRVFLHNILGALFRFAPSPVGYAKLARESGLANNTVAAGYIEQLSDLFSVMPAWQWDASRGIVMANKPCKFHFTNVAVAFAFHKSKIRSIAAFEALDASSKGVWLEWLVAQEIWRRTTLSHSASDAERTGFWKSKEHEIDFVTTDAHLIEVKWGKAGALDFSWFAKTFPKSQLTVVSQSIFESNHVRGVTPHDFLLHGYE